jgi:hypothetical protein
VGHAATNRVPVPQAVAEIKDAADGRETERDASGATGEEMKCETNIGER